MPSEIAWKGRDRRPHDVPRPIDARDPPEPDIVVPPLPDPEPDLPEGDELPER